MYRTSASYHRHTYLAHSIDMNNLRSLAPGPSLLFLLLLFLFLFFSSTFPRRCYPPSLVGAVVDQPLTVE